MSYCVPAGRERGVDGSAFRQPGGRIGMGLVPRPASRLCPCTRATPDHFLDGFVRRQVGALPRRSRLPALWQARSAPAQAGAAGLRASGSGRATCLRASALRQSDPAKVHWTFASGSSGRFKHPTGNRATGRPAPSCLPPAPEGFPLLALTSPDRTHRERSPPRPRRIAHDPAPHHRRRDRCHHAGAQHPHQRERHGNDPFQWLPVLLSEVQDRRFRTSRRTA